jgi:hypothetical protein
MLLHIMGLALSTSQPVVECNPITGWEEMLAERTPAFVVLGEMHGNAESPKIFADAVCLTAQAAPVVVALEQGEDNQPSIDRFLASEGNEQDLAEFRSAPMWNQAFKDGRSSKAMFAMFETLRQLHQVGRVSKVVAYMPLLAERPASTETWEAINAVSIIRGSHAGSTTLVLTGNVHASLSRVPWGDKYLPMAGHLPQPLTVALDITGNGGETWACTGEPVACGPIRNGRESDVFERGVTLSAEEDGRFSGVVYLGSPTTPSPPLNQLD